MTDSVGSLPLAVTMGDPAGIGPDITVCAWRSRHGANLPLFFAIGDPHIYRARMGLADATPVPVIEIESPEDARAHFDTALPVLNVTIPVGSVNEGLPSAGAVQAIVASIDMAVEFALSRRVSGVVTNPIAKHVLIAAGFNHTGHTDYLAHLANGVQPQRDRVHAVMLMASAKLMAVPLSVHIPLARVPGAVTEKLLADTVRVVVADMQRYFAIAAPRIAVCGLNPHAGETGSLGNEEIEIIAPAVTALAAAGYDIAGPLPADTLFHDAARATYDVVLAMYHDQALIPFKTLSFDDGVNVTLGLPFIRTSPDHGTAFALAGTGKASPQSFIEALRLADRMSRNAGGNPAKTQ